MTIFKTSTELFSHHSSILTDLKKTKFQVMCAGPLPTDDVIANYLGAHNLKFSMYLNDPIFSAFMDLPTQFGWNIPRKREGIPLNNIFNFHDLNLRFQHLLGYSVWRFMSTKIFSFGHNFEDSFHNLALHSQGYFSWGYGVVGLTDVTQKPQNQI